MQPSDFPELDATFQNYCMHFNMTAFPFSVTALQLIEYPYGDGIEVIFAGGRREFIPNNETDPEHSFSGERLDGRNLIHEWVDKHPNSQYVWNKTGFDQIDVEKVDHVIGWWLSKLYHMFVLFLVKVAVHSCENNVSRCPLYAPVSMLHPPTPSANGVQFVG